MWAWPRVVHNLMSKPVEKGGFDGARDSEGNVLISLKTLHSIWPNWIVPMTKRLKSACACDK